MLTPADDAARSGHVLGRPAEGPDATIRYADHADGLIDVFLPPSLGRPSAPRPLVVLVHGGFWRQAYDRTHLRPLAAALAAREYVVAIPEYRRVGEGGTGGWPQTGADVRQALSTVARSVAQVAPGWTDPDAPYTLVGHSAGGQLALWAGLHEGRGNVCRIVALAPVADLEGGARRGLGDGAVLDLMGGGPDDHPDAYADADPMRLLPGDVAVTLIQGTLDKQVVVDANRVVAERLADTETFTYVELNGVDHFALIDPLAAAFTEHVLPAISW